MSDDKKINGEKVIAAIFGHEPMRKDEYPTTFIVGQPFDGPDHDRICTRITRRQDNYGDHGIGWFDVWCGDDLVRSLSARATAEIHYAA